MIFKRAFALAFFTIVAGPALAADEPPVVQAILKNWETQYKIKPTYKSITGDGSNVTIEGLEATAPGGGNAKFSIGKIELANVADQGDGLYEIGTVTYSDFKLNFGGEAQGVTISIPQTVSEGWFVKALGDSPSPSDSFRAAMNIARKTSSGQITFNAGGQTVTADGYQVTWDGDPKTGGGKSAFQLSNITIPESVVTMMDASGTFKKIGYSALSFDLGGEGKFDVASEKVSFDYDVFVAGKDMGKLRLGTAAGEIPVMLMSEFQKQEGSQDFTKLMPMAQGIQISRIVLRFEDQSLTKRLLPLAAAIQGMDEQTLIASAGAVVQLALAQLKNPAFTEKTVAAVNAYLKDPRSITLAAKPGQPVTVMQVMSLDAANPGAAIDQLGVSVTAND